MPAPAGSAGTITLRVGDSLLTLRLDGDAVRWNPGWHATLRALAEARAAKTGCAGEP
jgi:hypothetical protein